VQNYNGAGNGVVNLGTAVEVGVLIFECPGCKGSVNIKSDAEIDSDVLLFHLGPYSGKRWLGVRGGKTSRLQIAADSAWKVTIGGLDLARRESGTSRLTGTGDDVLFLATAPQTADLTHKGKSNFIVTMQSQSGRWPEGLVNVIGPYQGTVLLKVDGKEAAVVQIDADGPWTPSPRVNSPGRSRRSSV